MTLRIPCSSAVDREASASRLAEASRLFRAAPFWISCVANAKSLLDHIIFFVTDLPNEITCKIRRGAGLFEKQDDLQRSRGGTLLLMLFTKVVLIACAMA